MIDDYTMVVHRFPDTVHVIPVGDVHLGAIEHDTSAWEEFIQNVLNAEDTYLILLGDLINNNTRSAVGNPFDEVYRPQEQKRIMTEHLKPLADANKILCVCSGNHERRSSKESDQDVTYDICSKLNIEHLYRQNVVFMKIALGSRGKPDDKQAKASYHFAVTHGGGGGIYTGAAVNRNERWGNIIEGVDALIVGHTHKGTLTRPSRIVIDPYNSTVSVKSYLVCSAESWMEYGGYAAQKMLLPSEHGRPQVLHLMASNHDKRIEVTW